jgi:hypothetical protein
MAGHWGLKLALKPRRDSRTASSRTVMADTDIYRTNSKWYYWYHPSDTKDERKLIAKLDILIVSYAFVTYWAKYLDQSNISQYKIVGYRLQLANIIT